ncbi:MAG: hypothetical protein ACI9SK_001382, partial [Zhongshania sp.]
LVNSLGVPLKIRITHGLCRSAQTAAYTQALAERKLMPSFRLNLITLTAAS